MSDYRPLNEPWLERFHINKYVKKYDARVEGRYLNPPEYDRLEVGDKVMVHPRGRYKLWIDNWRGLQGKYGKVIEIRKDLGSSKYFGKHVRVKLVIGPEITLREAAFLRKS